MMQATNRFQYDAAIGRVWTTFTFSQPLFPCILKVASKDKKAAPSLVLHDLSKQQKYVTMSENGLRHTLGLVQAGQDLFVLTDKIGNMSWSLYKKKLVMDQEAERANSWQMVLQDSGTFSSDKNPKESCFTRHFTSLCCVQKVHVYMLGGQINMNKATGSCVKFDLYCRRVWEEVPSLTIARYWHSSCVLGSCIYVIGGMSKDEIGLGFG